VNKHLYLCHPLVLSSPTLMMHGHTNLKFPRKFISVQMYFKTRVLSTQFFRISALYFWKRHCVSITKADRLMLYTAMIAVLWNIQNT